MSRTVPIKFTPPLSKQRIKMPLYENTAAFLRNFSGAERKRLAVHLFYKSFTNIWNIFPVCAIILPAAAPPH